MSQGRSLTRKTLNAEKPFTELTAKEALGVRGRREKAQDFEPVRQRKVCAMKCGVAPSQPADEHHSITALHQR